MTPSDAELLLLKEEISLTFGNGSGDGKAYCDLEDIFLWVFAHDQAREQQLLTELLRELPDKEYYANGTAAVGTQFAGFNEAIDQVVSVIERYRERL